MLDGMDSTFNSQLSTLNERLEKVKHKKANLQNSVENMKQTFVNFFGDQKSQHIHEQLSLLESHDKNSDLHKEIKLIQSQIKECLQDSLSDQNSQRLNSIIHKLDLTFFKINSSISLSNSINDNNSTLQSIQNNEASNGKAEGLVVQDNESKENSTYDSFKESQENS